MDKLKRGFYTALGTPVDREGNLDAASLRAHIEDQIAHDASGILLMGSMGMQPCVRNEAYVEAARVAADTVKGRVPLFVGVMDNSSWRVKDRIRSLSGLAITAVVLTPPFYFGGNQTQLLKFFTDVADESEYPVFLYDLPGATKIKITFDMVKVLATHKNILGIKSGDMTLVRQIKYAFPTFEALYSNIDCFDAAMAYGMDKVLDGMFSCTPNNARIFAQACAEGNMTLAGETLNKILHLRDTFVKYSVFPSFTAAMNLLGFTGEFGPDFCGNVTDEEKQVIADELKAMGEL